MPRRKRVHPMLLVAGRYFEQHMPGMRGVPLQIHTLDGPPDAPRYAVTAESCREGECPHRFSGLPMTTSDCAIVDCPLRHSVRLLLDRRGCVLQVMPGGVHWR